MKQVLILDTTVMCCWLQIPGKETCGPDDNKLDYKQTDELIKSRLEEGYYLVLPITSLLETGNHIAQANGHRYEMAMELAEMLRKSASGDAPWAAFTEQTTLFSEARLLNIADYWPERAAAKTSIGDFLIEDVVKYYSDAGMHVEIFTGDAGLKAQEPSKDAKIPRRRR